MTKIKLSKNYSIRRMRLLDAPFYNSIRNECRMFLHDHTQYSPKECRKWFINTLPTFFILFYNRKKIGYFRTSDWGDDKSAFIGLDLHSDFRGLTHAQKSYPLFMNYLRNEFGISKFYLRVLKNNPVAKHIYDKLGFNVVQETNIDFKMELL